MPKFSLDGYREQWPRIGAVLGMAVAGVTALTSRRMSKPQLFSTLNFGGLLVHQYEEYVDPGWFPGQFNHGVLKSDQPRNFPLNPNSALCVNVPAAYPFYILPILFPKVKWLGLAPVFFGIFQSVAHGVFIPRLAGDKYSPGFLASIFLHVPIGIRYIQSLKKTEGLSRGDIVGGVVYMIAFAFVGVVLPNVLGDRRDSKYVWGKKQMGRHDVGTIGKKR